VNLSKASSHERDEALGKAWILAASAEIELAHGSTEVAIAQATIATAWAAIAQASGSVRPPRKA